MKKRSLSEWSEEIDAQEASGETQQEWCAARNININTYRDRKSTIKAQAKKEASKETPSESMGWMTVNVAKASSQSSKMPQVKIGSFIILPEADFCETTFIRICKALKTLC